MWTKQWRLGLAIAWILALCPTWTLAGPLVNVQLQTPFSAPPLTAELLETAAQENSSAFHPLLKSIIQGKLGHFLTDAEVPQDENYQPPAEEKAYQRFLQVLQEDRIITDPAALASLQLAVSVHAAVPRLEAHYQFYETEVEYLVRQYHGDQSFKPAYAFFMPSGEYCGDPKCDFPARLKYRSGRDHREPLPFDRVVGSAPASELWTMYLDPADDAAIRMLYQWSKKYPNAGYRLRYKRSEFAKKPLSVSGYGVELALKRTDYMVIDDRDAENIDKASAAEEQSNRAQNVSARDVTPLSSSELHDLGWKLASHVLATEDPFASLVKYTQDLPKYASSIASHNVTRSFLEEHHGNREQLLPAGYNMMWMNGVQVSPRDVNIFTLLDKLRQERRLISGLTDLGMTAGNANKLLSHPAIVETQAADEPQRYDFRDAEEGGKVIIWLNDIEKDKRYAEWPKALSTLLQRTFPGQLPAVRRDIHNVVFPVDLADPQSVTLATDTLRNLVQRMVPVRFGLVPAGLKRSAIEQTKMVYYLQDAYGLAAVMEYLELSASNRALNTPNQQFFDAASSSRPLRREQVALSLAEVVSSETYSDRSSKAQAYINRLGADTPSPPIFVNGAPVPFDEEWMQLLSQRLGLDLRTLQQRVYEETINPEMWLPDMFLQKASPRRNPLIVPEDENSVKLFDMSKLYVEHGRELQGLKSLNEGSPEEPSLVLWMDLMSADGCELLHQAVRYSQGHPEVRVLLNHHSENRSPQWLDHAMTHLEAFAPDFNPAQRAAIRAALDKDPVARGKRLSAATSPLAEFVGLQAGQSAVLINGRLVGPIPKTAGLTAQDFDTLVTYERKKRILPTLEAIKGLDLSSILQTPQDLAKLTSLVALSIVSDTPEGIFDTTPGPRTSIFDAWKDQHTIITLGKPEDASINFVVSLDPVSEVAQRWVPLLHVLSQLHGVHVKIFLNPKERMQELPVKRFYRHVLDAVPQFDQEGRRATSRASFSGIPEETLVTLAMDTPPSWLVAPKESVQDLDNIKLSSLRSNDNVEALYELEHILIEGHSRESTTAAAPRGVQLSLNAGADKNIAGTIIMANIGYFQFKANPGVYSLALQEGKSTQVYDIESAGTAGWAAQAGDESTELYLDSFTGATIFPRLARKPGHEEDDVLEMPAIGMQELASGATKQVQAVLAKGGDYVDGLIAKAGFPKLSVKDLATQGAAYGQSLLSRAMSATGSPAAIETALTQSKHADINIFSVASGHLYERMLNIMMVSVMRHTKHSVKFWFIEQFLSPSFKTFLPTMAAEYGFDYEMVTYKWPHWLRAQKEKQREIWGYKILFLDVLFPLDLDKVIFVDADQIVRTDMYELVQYDLQGAPYGFTPMCDSREEIEGFRFWKQGYWKTFLRGLPYHISALYVVDLKMFRAMAAGDRLRQQYQSLSSDPNSLSNLDQDLPNHMQMNLPIHSLPQEWLWCETWCDDESLKSAKTIDLCNNPMTKEPKLDRARRQVPEWTKYDEEIASLARRKKAEGDPAAVGIAVENAEEAGANDPRPAKDEL